MTNEPQLRSRPLTTSPFEWHPYLRDARDSAECAQRVKEALAGGVSFAAVYEVAAIAAANKREATR